MQLKSVLKKDEYGLPGNLVLEASIRGGVILRTKVTVLQPLDIEFNEGVTTMIEGHEVHLPFKIAGLYGEMVPQLARFIQVAELLRMVYRQNFESKYVHVTPGQAVEMVVAAARSETYAKLGIVVEMDEPEYNGDGEERDAEFDSKTGGV